jgi:hypothetical protein
VDNKISLFHSDDSSLSVCDEIVGCETLSTKAIKRFGNIFLGLLTTSFSNTSPSPARVKIATMVFALE